MCFVTAYRHHSGDPLIRAEAARFHVVARSGLCSVYPG